MPTVTSSRRIPWSGLAIAALTVGLFVWFLWGLDPEALRLALSHANPWLVLLAVVVTLQTYVVRAWRWKAMLLPLGDVPFRPAFRTTVVGFTATFLIPGRVGEVLRPYLLAKQRDLSVSATFATIIVERAMDLVAVLVLFAAAQPFIGVDVGDDVRMAGWLAALAAFVGLGVLAISAGHPERVGRMVDRLGGWLPQRLARVLGQFARRFAEGLSILRDPLALARIMAWSLVLWISIAAGIWLVTRAFGLTMPFAGSFLVVMYLVVGVAAPTPGGAGGFHVMYKLAVTQYFGASPEVGVAAGTVLHLATFVPVAILGLWYMRQDGLTLGGLKRMNTEGGSPA